MTTRTTHAERRRIIELLNDALSAEYHSFIGHALNSIISSDARAWYRSCGHKR